MTWQTKDLTVGQRVEATRSLGGGAVEGEFEDATVVEFDNYDMKDGNPPVRRAIIEFDGGQRVPFVEGSPAVRVPGT